jgi:hypothetical protein
LPLAALVSSQTSLPFFLSIMTCLISLASEVDSSGIQELLQPT